MDLNHPAHAILGANRARTLQVLSTLADPAAGRRIHELSGNKSLRTTQSILDDLLAAGMVDMRRIGSSHAYSLNREHILWSATLELLAAPAALEQKIGEIIQEELGQHAAGSALFGSFARGEAGPDSDVDILILWNGEVDHELAALLLAQAEDRIRRLSGNRAQFVTLTASELEDLAKRDDPFAASISRDARQLTTGVQVKAVARGDQ